ncbi:MAG: ester cyclase [Nitrospirae bacterium]|nr:ester cyclase [Nitrospirota bacterium]MBF0535296.1 ester cyclase [Nitrospirota bacterium]MBF0617281.1 ester cyclase [Nitrospirota bacterium]
MKAIISRLWDEVWTLGKMDVISEIIDEKCVNHISGFPDLPGWDGLKGFVSLFRSAFPDIKFTIADQIEERDKVATRWIAKGTHKGELMGIAPTGRIVTVEGITIYRFDNNKGVEAWTSWDGAGLMKKLTM